MLLTAVLLVLVASVAAPEAARAGSCDQRLVDGEGREYVTNDRGATSVAGAYLAHAYFTRNWYYDDEAGGVCTPAAEGQEVRYAEHELEGQPGVFFAPRVYVPRTGPAFVRTLLVLRNAGGAPARLPVFVYDDVPRPGSSEVLATSDGDWTFGPADAWAVLRDAAGGTGAPRFALVARDSAGEGRGPDAVYDWTVRGAVPRPAFADGDDEPQLHFADVAIPPGGTVVVLHAAAVRASTAAARAAASDLAAAPAALFAGMSAAEVAALHNVVPADLDGDGVANVRDTCRAVPDPAQRDADGDGRGDLCDDDRDGDGSADAVEARRGSDPDRADSDGDGLRDGLDECPVLAGPEGGCPPDDRAEEEPALEPEEEQESLRLALRGPRSVTLANLRRRGLAVRVGADDEADVTLRLLAKGDGVLLRRARVALVPGARTVRLVPRGRLPRLRRTGLVVEAEAVGADGVLVDETLAVRVR